MAAFVLAFAHNAARAEVFTGVHNGPDYSLYENSEVLKNSVVEFDSLNIRDTLKLENYGEISSSIFIEDNCKLYFKNSGTFSGEIYFGEDSALVQMITSGADLNRLSLVNGGSFTVLVQGGEALSLSEIMRVGSGADKIILDGATITLGGPAMRGVPPRIEIEGEVWIDLANLSVSKGMLLLDNVLEGGAINIVGADVGNLHYGAARRDGNSIILDILRETDYLKILGPASLRGKFLNSVRAANPNSRMLAALDSQETMRGINNVMNNSVAFNPINLIRPVLLFNRLETVPTSGHVGDMLFEPVYIFGGGMNLYAGKIGLGIKLDDFTIMAAVMGGKLSVANSVDEFSGDFYGGNLSAYWNGESLWCGATAGYSEAKFRTDGIFDDGGAVYDPRGNAMYFSADSGINFRDGEFYLAPFAGAGVGRQDVLYQSETDFYIQAGSKAGFATEVLGIKYDYGIFASAATDSVFIAGAKFATWSVADGAGTEFSAAAIRDAIGMAYKFSVTAKFNF